MIGQTEAEEEIERKRRSLPSFIDHIVWKNTVMKRVTTYESGGDSDDEFIEYVFDFCGIRGNNIFIIAFWV